jgi:hypothetical protein
VNRTVVVGPFPIYFGNVNKAMGLRGHYHTGAVTLHYGYPQAAHGYPSFKETNDELRGHLVELTHGIFKDATNEDVATRLWEDLVWWMGDTWRQWGGTYWLDRLDLDVEGVHDDIGHDASTTRYTRALENGDPVYVIPVQRALADADL